VRRAAKKERYHHGDLRAALIDTAVELIAERGVAGFSLAEASRRLGVAASAPYRHFADRDELLVAAGVRACETLLAVVAAEDTGGGTPAERLVAAARGYVRFAADHRPLFETVFGSNLDRARHPELERASQPLKDTFATAALALSDGDPGAAAALAAAVGTTAHGHAVMLHLHAFGRPELTGHPDTTGPAIGAAAVRLAVERVSAATRALIAGRSELGTVARPEPAGGPGGGRAT
jgi:AcrR family transcriptional regulator